MAKQKTLLVITGEKSGEMHAAKVCTQLLNSDPSIRIVGWGGDEMKAAGVDVKRHTSTLAIMGFWEVLKRIFFLRQLFKECKKLILDEKPDLILYVDYSGFNLRMGKWSSQNGFLNHYYIPPKTWAWNSKRTYKLRSFFEKVYTILPFENDFFKGYGVKSYYVGNPILQSIESELTSRKPKQEKKIIALVPGSRAGEISKVLPVMCQLRKQHPEYDYIISGVSSVDSKLYDIADLNDIPVKYDDFYNIIKTSDYAIVTSGTATLETAMLNVPQIVVFKTSWLTYLVARLFVKIKFISLVNLIAEEAVVDELIQNNFNVKSLSLSLSLLIKNRSIILKKYSTIRQRIGTKDASFEVSRHILKEFNQ